MKLMKDVLDRLVGQPILVLCARYFWRGILVAYDEEILVLRDPYVVENTGSLTADRATTEDALPSDLILRWKFVEAVCQPPLVLAGYQLPKGKENRRFFGEVPESK